MAARWILAALLVSAFGCATSHPKSNNPADPAIAGSGDDQAATDGDEDNGEAGPPVNKSEVSSHEIEVNSEHAYKSQYGDVNLKVNSLVEKWIDYFQGRGRHWMELYLSRSTRYMPMMKNTLREYGLPEDLVYVAMIESGFSPVARSRTAAVGYWQFMRSTARTYGLTVNAFIDERRDPVLSTRAAAEYFKALYNLFGSWHLALASYNSGENRVKSVVMRNFTRDFWELVRLRKVPPETQNYVPKFIAAALIAKDPTQYGFKEIQFEPMLNYDTVKVINPISLKKMAANLAVDFAELELLNPKYRSDYVPVYRSSETLLRVPIGMKDRALAVLDLSTSAPPRYLAVEGDVYKVRHGDTLGSIAQHHGCSVATLQRLNNLRGRSMLRIGQRIHVPEQYGGVERVSDRRKPSSREETNANAQAAVDTEPAAASADPLFHVVRRGENLSTIARHYNTTVNELRRLNKIGNHKTLRAGERLMIRQPGSEKVQNSSVVSRTRALAVHRPQVHVVRRGETLAHIAQHYKVPLAALVAANDLHSSQVLMAGRSLKIPAGRLQ